MGHRDIKTTLIYADYAPSAQEKAMVGSRLSLRPSSMMRRAIRRSRPSGAIQGPRRVAIDRAGSIDFVVGEGQP